MLDRIGLGLAALGRPGYLTLGHDADLPAKDIAAMEAQCHAVLDAAWAAGVRWVDAARSYGRAEEFLASWLRSRKIAPGDLFVSSKWGYAYTAGWRVHADQHEVKDHSVAQLKRQWPETLALLGPWLGLYQIHSATMESGVLDDPAIPDALERIRARGVQVGLTLTGPRQAETLRQALELKLFDAVQATWNLLEPSVGPALVEAKRAGLRIINKEALANGRLTARGGIALLDRTAAHLGTTSDALAIACALKQPFVDVVLSGAATVEQLQSNLRLPVVDDATLAELSGLAEDPAAYWSARSKLAWN
jgi:aryl-alcohol dehydrogenase-like predicted oxidoreductase